MKVEVYNQQNKKVETTDLPDQMFKTDWNADLVHQSLMVYLANNRRHLAHTKTRGEVSGGGKKPWRQKGTGRARHGSIRSPIWRGGGITFGPRTEKKFSRKINKKMKNLALWSVLSKKWQDQEIQIIDNLEINDQKTKNFTAIIDNFFKSNDRKKASILFVSGKSNKSAYLAGRNIPKVTISNPESLNIYNLLLHKYVFFEKSAVQEIIEHFKIKS